jgi:hypothetical protein
VPPADPPPASLPDNLRASADGLLRGLLTLQVNTILKDGMTGEQVPTISHALIDVAYAYLDYLQEVAGMRLAEPPGAARGPAELMLLGTWPRQRLAEEQYETLRGDALLPAVPAEQFGGDIRVTPGVFHVLREAAARALKERRNDGTADAAVLRRIVANCDSIKLVLTKPDAMRAWNRPLGDGTGPTRADLVGNRSLVEAWYAVPANDALVIRHAWEIGTERILAQTVVQLRGDIVTRLDPDAAGLPALQSMHQLGINAALGHWHDLLALVVQIAGRVLGVAKGR